MIKQFYFLQVNLSSVFCLLSVYMSNISIWPINRTLSGANSPGQGGAGNDENEEVLLIHQNSTILEPRHQIVLCHILGSNFLRATVNGHHISSFPL